MDFRLAVRAFIVKNNDVLILQREKNSVQKPGIWEIPGGRLEPGENPFLGLQREVKEETGLNITVLEPLSVRHFVRDDGQTITMLIFECIADSKTVRLSSEHDAFQWIEVSKAKGVISSFYDDEVDLYQKRHGLLYPT